MENDMSLLVRRRVSCDFSEPIPGDSGMYDYKWFDALLLLYRKHTTFWYKTMNYLNMVVLNCTRDLADKLH